MKQATAAHFQTPEQYLMFYHDYRLNWGWTRAELDTFRLLWEKGMPIWDIAKRMKRDPDEVAMLAIDQARSGGIKKRPGWAWGGRK